MSSVRAHSIGENGLGLAPTTMLERLGGRYALMMIGRGSSNLSVKTLVCINWRIWKSKYAFDNPIDIAPQGAI